MKLFNYKKESPKKVNKSSKTTPVLIRFDNQDLELIKEQAEADGLPYQTYIKSILHKAVKRRL